MRLVVTAALALLASPAWAGGVGVLATGGAHTEKVFFYSDHTTDGVEYSDIDDYDQYEMSQTLPNFGTGFELILGDRDDRIMGNCRFYWVMDSPQKDPAETTDQVDPAYVVAAYREDPRHVGLGLVGLSWGIVGRPEKFQLVAIGHVGSAFLTTDHTEFLALDLGPGVTYKASRQVQLFADVSYQARFRKDWSQSVNGFLGARYLFD